MSMLRDIRQRLDSTAVLLILANLVPLYGVLVWDWEVFAVLFLFWTENIVIGIFNAARMLAARASEPLAWAEKLFLIGFFCVHYGLFTAIHGTFVISLFGGGEDRPDVIENPAVIGDIIAEQQLAIPVAALFVSHGYSFLVNFLLRGEYRHTSPKTLMARPYSRIVLLHLTILAGGALVQALETPLIGLILLIALKIAMDLHAHIRSHTSEQRDPVD